MTNPDFKLPEWLSIKAIAQFEAIRRLGQTNMLDASMVQRIAYENGFHELVVAMENKGFYPLIFVHYGEMLRLLKEDDIPKARKVIMKFELDMEDVEDE